MNMSGDGGAIAPTEMAMQKNQLKIRRSKLPRRKRAGSVMIMVVALLVLMALMGTAWIATVRTDRGASAANVANTQSEMLLQGLKEVTAAKVGIDSVYDQNSTWRPRQEYDTAGLPMFSYVDAIYPLPENNGIVEETDHANEFLASRVPQLSPAQLGSLQVQVYWPAISAPLLSGPDDPVPARRASAATELTSEFIFSSPVPSTKNGRTQYRDRTLAYPTIIELTRNGMTEKHPALTFDGNDAFLAADADGDGVADAGLWRLPLGQQNGITWFAAVRIIDNNSAINAAVAAEWDTTAAGRAQQFFPSNISVSGVLQGSGASSPANQLLKLNLHRSGGQTIVAGTPALKDDGSSAGFNWLSVEDALWTQLGRRPENPGLTGPGTTRARALDLTDHFSLASRFVYDNQDVVTKLEELTWPTLMGRTRENVIYGQTQASIRDWFDQNFDYNVTVYNRRPLMVTRNAVSNHAQYARDSAAPANIYVPDAIGADFDKVNVADRQSIKFTPIPVKASLNTGTFAQLWLAYWNVMADRVNPGFAQNPARDDTTPFGAQIDANPGSAATILQDAYYGMASGEEHPWRMFRSSIRDLDQTKTDYRFLPHQQHLLRSAIAAFNTVRLRSNFTKDSETIPLNVHNNTKVKVKLYGYDDPQPFITEVYVHANTTMVANDPDLVVDDRNPNGYIAVELHNPFSASVDLAGYKLAIIDRKAIYPLNVQEIHTFAARTIPKGGFIVLENVTPTGTSGVYRPRAVGVVDAALLVHVPRLHEAADKELVLLKPAGGSDVKVDMMPVDQFDFTGLVMPAENAADAFSWHYSRSCTPRGASNESRWECVFPGRYDGTRTTMRQDGTTDSKSHYNPTPPAPVNPGDPPGVAATDPWIETTNQPSQKITLGKPSDAAPGQKKFVVRLERSPVAVAQYPFGGFARVGDIVQAPFIGAYVVYAGEVTDGRIIEMNAITMDSMFADDSDPTNDTVEQLGRFSPLLSSDWSPNRTAWRYRWAMKVFDYFTVFAPDQDFQPSAPKEVANKQPVGNTRSGQPNSEEERLLGVEGLININTAPWRVLAAVPLLEPDGSNAVTTAIEQLAQRIVADRDANGPYRNLYDLYRIAEVRNQIVDRDGDGEIDFEEQLLPLTRLSNLITTRSDTFTAYLLIQGWRGVSSDEPELVAQRRMGVFIDRNPVRTNRGDVKTYIFPVE